MIDEDIIESGRDLLLVKKRIGHGNFLPWIEAAHYVGAKNAPGAYLNGVGLKLIEELTSSTTPLEVREEVEEMIEAGDIRHRQRMQESREEME